jgi:hypothetical protein
VRVDGVFGFLVLLCLVVSNVQRDSDLLHGIAPFELIPPRRENREFVAVFVAARFLSLSL